jgi:hypothetical protein
MTTDDFQVAYGFKQDAAKKDRAHLFLRRKSMGASAPCYVIDIEDFVGTDGDVRGYVERRLEELGA